MLYVRGTKVRRTTYAEVLELADRLDSGSSVGNDVRVQVPSSALRMKEVLEIRLLFFVLSPYKNIDFFING